MLSTHTSTLALLALGAFTVANATDSSWQIATNGIELVRGNMVISAETSTEVDRINVPSLYGALRVRNNNDDGTIQRFNFKDANGETLMKITIIDEFLIDTNVIVPGTRARITVSEDNLSTCSHRIRANEAYNMKSASLKCDELTSNCGSTGAGEEFASGMNYVTAIRTEHRMSYNSISDSFEFRVYQTCVKGPNQGDYDEFLCGNTNTWPSKGAGEVYVRDNCLNTGAGRRR